MLVKSQQVTNVNPYLLRFDAYYILERVSSRAPHSRPLVEKGLLAVLFRHNNSLFVPFASFVCRTIAAVYKCQVVLYDFWSGWVHSTGNIIIFIISPVPPFLHFRTFYHTYVRTGTSRTYVSASPYRTGHSPISLHCVKFRSVNKFRWRVEFYWAAGTNASHSIKRQTAGRQQTPFACFRLFTRTFSLVFDVFRMCNLVRYTP